MDYISPELRELAATFFVIYLLIGLTLLMGLFAFVLARYATSKDKHDEADDFQPTRMYDFNEPRMFAGQEGWYCLSFLDGARVLGKGKTPERARQSHDRRLKSMIAAVEKFEGTAP